MSEMLSLMYVESLFQFGVKVGKWEGYYGDKNYLYTYFQWTEDRQGFEIQYLTFDTWPSLVPIVWPSSESKVKFWIGITLHNRKI